MWCMLPIHEEYRYSRFDSNSDPPGKFDLHRLHCIYNDLDEGAAINADAGCLGDCYRSTSGRLLTSFALGLLVVVYRIYDRWGPRILFHFAALLLLAYG